ncbi:MAG: MFS transporter [Candidatus Sumerlaeia bacterium]|nr:MFS transporter [Candidatus Sumerlaeia bacterium]
MNRPVLVIGLIALLQVLCVGANFTTLKFYGESLGGSGLAVGWLWVALSVPRALVSPFWGSLSDRIGRRPVLAIGSLGAIGGSVLWALSGSWEALLVSRLLDGFLGAHATVAFSVIGDSTAPEKRAAGMGMVGALVLVGFTIGPVMGGVGASMVGLAGLGWVMAGLQAAGLVLMLVALPETCPAATRTAARGSLLPEAFRPAAWGQLLRLPTVAGLLVVCFVLTGAFAIYNTAFPNAAAVWYSWDQRDLALAFVVLGLGGALAQGGLVRPLAPRLGERRLVLIGGGVLALGFALLALGLPVWGALGATGLVAVGGGLAFPCVNALLSRSAPEQRQGLLLGIGQMAQGLGRGGGFLAGSAFEATSLTLPWWLAVAGVVVSLAVLGLGTQARR